VTSGRTVRQTPSDQKQLANRIEAKALKNTRRNLNLKLKAPKLLLVHGSPKELKLLRKYLGKM
jgi:hypothetical protein